MAVPYTFGTATSAIPLSQLDSNFSTPITLGNTAIQLGNVVTTLNNMTLANVTISSGSITIPYGNANAVVYTNSSNVATTSTALTFDGTILNASTGTPIIRATASTVGSLYGFELNGGALDAFVKAQPNTSELRIGSGRSAGWGGFTTFYIDTAEQMRLTSTGLGIGTSSPGVKLDVSGAIRSLVSGGTPIIYFNNGTTQHSISNSSGAMPFAIDGAEKMRLDSSGNLGIGVTPSAWVTVSPVLQANNASFTGYNNQAILSSNWYYNAGNKYIANGYATQYSQTSGQHIWYTAANNVSGAGAAITFTQAMTLDASGHQLVGYTSSVGTAYQPNVQVKGSSSSNYGAYGIVSSNNELLGMMGIWSNGENSLWISADPDNLRASSNIVFSVDATERARIDSSGNFMLGTTSAINSGKFSILWNGTSVNAIELEESSGASGAGFVLFRNSSATAIGSITRVTTTNAVVYNTTSDYRLKDIVGAVTGSGERIDALKPVDYTWKEDGSAARGFLAHEFKEVYANSVTGEKDAVDADGNPVYQSMQASTSEVIADLVAEIQSLRKRVAQLEGK